MRYDALLLLAAIIMISGCSGISETGAEYNQINVISVDTDDEDTVLKAASIIETRLEQRDVPSKAILENSSDGWQIKLRTPETKPSIIKSTLSRSRINATYPFHVEDERYFNISQPHLVENTGDSVKIDSSEYRDGEKGEIENTTFIVRRTGEKSRIDFVLYDIEEINDVISSEKQVRASSSGYQATLPIIIDEEAANRMMLMSKNYGGESYLRHPNGTRVDMTLHMSGERRGLSISSVFRTQKVERPNIMVGGETEDEVRRKIMLYEASIVSGKMPVDAELVSYDMVEN